MSAVKIYNLTILQEGYFMQSISDFYIVRRIYFDYFTMEFAPFIVFEWIEKTQECYVNMIHVLRPCSYSYFCQIMCLFLNKKLIIENYVFPGTHYNNCTPYSVTTLSNHLSNIHTPRTYFLILDTNLFSSIGLASRKLGCRKSI